jgi:hypothetical protein
MSAANRRIVSLTDWISAYPKALWTTSRKAEMVSDGSRAGKFASYSLTNIQQPAYNILMDFIFAIYPWLIMWKLDMKKSEKLGLCVVMSLVSPATSTTPLCTECTEPTLTLATTGYGHRNLNRNPNALEVSRQRQRRTVLLAPRHVGHLVLFRSCRHYHRAVRPSAAGAGQRCPFDAPFDGTVEAAGVHGRI